MAFKSDLALCVVFQETFFNTDDNLTNLIKQRNDALIHASGSQHTYRFPRWVIRKVLPS